MDTIGWQWIDWEPRYLFNSDSLLVTTSLDKKQRKFVLVCQRVVLSQSKVKKSCQKDFKNKILKTIKKNWNVNFLLLLLLLVLLFFIVLYFSNICSLVTNSARNCLDFFSYPTSSFKCFILYTKCSSTSFHTTFSFATIHISCYSCSIYWSIKCWIFTSKEFAIYFYSMS
jgi:hypothetical protein